MGNLAVTKADKKAPGQRGVKCHVELAIVGFGLGIPGGALISSLIIVESDNTPDSGAGNAQTVSTAIRKPVFPLLDKG